MDINLIKKVANNISNPNYDENLQATQELIELFDKISRKPLQTAEKIENHQGTIDRLIEINFRLVEE